jgi:hypothetical protein
VGGTEYLTVLEVRYERISVEPFREPPGSPLLRVARCMSASGK